MISPVSQDPNYSFKIAGKCEPKIDSFTILEDAGFTNFELYLNTTILDNRSIEDIVSVCNSIDSTIVTVHTPHISLTEGCKEYYEKTDEIASQLNAVLVFDSNPTSTRYGPQTYSINKSSAEIGYENDPGISAYYLQNYHLNNGYKLVLDTAHLHMSETDWSSIFETLLSSYQEQIPAIHLADGTKNRDGVAFGKGTVPIKEIVNLLDLYEYTGIVVLETAQEDQPKALNFIKNL